MTILTTGKNISICCNEEDIEKGVKHYYVLKGTGIYDAHDNFRKVEGVKTRLSEEHVSEYVHLLKTANNVWEQKRMQIESKKTQNDFQENLEQDVFNILNCQREEIKRLQNLNDTVIADLKWYLDTNEELGVVYIPKFIVEKALKNLKEMAG